MAARKSSALVGETPLKMGNPPKRGRIVVAGGSLGGLTAALLLADAGLDVDVFERSAT